MKPELTKEDKAGTMLASSETFATALGHATWLAATSREHREKPISWLEEFVFPALAMKQFKLYFKGKQPVALLIFAFVSDEVKERWEKDRTMPKLTDWRSGKNVIVLECVSPFAERQVVIDEFMGSGKC